MIMKHIYIALGLLLAGLAACAVEPVPESADGTAVSTRIAGVSTTSALSCQQVWQCDSCDTWSFTNVLHEICDDGSDTVIVAHSCQESCW